MILIIGIVIVLIIVLFLVLRMNAEKTSSDEKGIVELRDNKNICKDILNEVNAKDVKILINENEK